MTYDRYPFSNTISDTITSSVAQWYPTTGSLKHSAVNVSGTSNLTASISTNVGGNNCVAATLDAVNTKFTTEITIDSNNPTGGGGFGFYVAGSPSFASSVATLPGGTSAPNGISFSWIIGGNVVGLFRNGVSGGSSQFAAGTTIAAGDVLHLEVDTVAHTVAYKFLDASAAYAVTASGTITLTSLIPSTWRAFARVVKGVGTSFDQITANFGASAWKATPAAGFDHPYA
jgi:hypothetical protein